MKLFGRSSGTAPGGGPLVIAFLEGWAVADEACAHPAVAARTPAWARLIRRGRAFHLPLLTGRDTSGRHTSGRKPPGRDATAALAAIAEAHPPEAPDADLARLLRHEGGLMAHPGFSAFVRDLARVGGDCHLVGVLTDSRIEGHTGHLARIAATLAHEGIRVWLHAILDGRDNAPDGALAELRAFQDDTAGLPDIRLATIAGRAHVLDETADERSRAALRLVVAEATPAAGEDLALHIDRANRRGTGDALIQPVAARDYPGLRSDDAILTVHPRPDGLAALAAALAPEDALNVPGPRPIALTACRALIGWPHEGAPGRAPIAPFQPARPRLTDHLIHQGAAPLMAAPASFLARAAAAFEGSPESASRIEPHAGLLEVADAAVAAIKAGAQGPVIAFLGGIPATARSPEGASQARRIAELQDKALGRIAAMLERRGGTLLAVGTDAALDTGGRATGLPALLLGDAEPAGMAGTAALRGLEDIAGLILDLARARLSQAQSA